MPATPPRASSPPLRSNLRLTVLAALLLIPGLSAISAAAEPPTPGVAPAETLILFDFAAGETPESVRFDRFDNAYVTLSGLGEIRKITPDLQMTTLAVLPLGGPCPPRPAVALGLTFDLQDRLYVAVNACDPANQGIWSVDTESGAAESVIPLPAGVVANGIDADGGFIYVADTFGGRVLRAPADGSGSLEVWADDPLLDLDPTGIGPGPNGLKVFERTVYVAVSSQETMVAIPMRADGSAGTPAVYFTFPPGVGCDEFAFDVHGALFCTTDPTNQVIRIAPGGTAGEVLLDAADLLDGPTSVAFGRRGGNRKNLYVTNAAFPVFTDTFRPSLMRVRLDVPGAPAAR
jgi:sugar lactone lactonase YvrE